ncbi:MAG: type II toxin-antitoxin system VapC family toxin [Trueperaceae bacterium]|nr:type II toxin-antitoxin system VapC family toxin [Trueperaceae bacterium]
MKILLDTHVWLWMLAAPERLGRAAPMLEEARNELLLSAASVWEIAIKTALGRLELPVPVARYVPDRMRRSGVVSLPIESAHALAVADLPPLHRDPFDRMLVAQAQHLGVPIATADPLVAAYDVEVLEVGVRR